jgi:hypothetical protein
MTKAEHSAFPADANTHTEGGLTKREYFAAMAMQGLLTRVPNRPNNETDLGVIELKRISEESVIMADALINALNEQK